VEDVSKARLKVALFTFRGELYVQPGEDVKEVDFGPMPTLAAATAGTILSLPKRNANRATFLVRTPEHAGLYRLRCAVYFNDALIQSRLVFVKVRLLPVVVEKLLSVLVDFGRGVLTDTSQSARSRIDFSLSRTLEPSQLVQFRSHKLSLMLNDNGDGTHTLRLIGGDFKGDATFDGTYLQDHIDTVRGALRKAAWDSEDNWEAKFHYKYETPGDLNFKRLEADISKLAIEGYRFYDDIIAKFKDPKQSKDLTELMREPGRVEVALKRGPSNLVIPASLLYDYTNLAPWTFPWKLCDHFKSNMLTDVPLEETACFRGACPSLDDNKVVCPGGFWGFRHNLGLPLSVLEGNSAPTHIECPDGPRLAVAVSTDPSLTRRTTHEEALRKLLPSDHWHYASTFEGTLTLMKESRAAIVYFYCHGGVGGDKKNIPYLRVGPANGPGIERLSLRSAKVSWEAPRPLVFINGCHTAALEPKTAISLVSGFIETAHASGVIGTEITVFESLATTFAEECLRRFIVKKVEIGEAIRGARLALLKRGNPLGLAYIPYVTTVLQLK
jgi:hypothetical protein